MKIFVRKNIANIITISRSIFPPLFIFSAIINSSGLFLVFIILQFLLDFLDGFTARLMNIQSELGSKLDTVMDTINMSLMNIIFIYLTWDKTSDIRENHISLLYVTIALLLMRHILSIIFLKKPSTIHLWSGKISGGVLLCTIIITLQWTFYTWLFYLVCGCYILYGIEAMLIYLIKKKNTNEGITTILQIRVGSKMS